MLGGESDAPPPNGGEFLLRLLKNPHQYSSQLQQSQLLTDDPAVTEFGPSFPMPFVQNSQRDVLRHALPENIGPPPQAQPPPPSAPHQYFRKSRDSNPEQRNNVSNFTSNQQEQQGLVFGSFKDKDGSNNGFSNESPLISRQGYFNRGSNGLEVQGYHSNSPEFERDKHWNSVDSRVHVQDQQWDRNGHKKPHSLVDSRVHVQEGMNHSRGHTELYSKVPTAFHGVDVKQNIGYTNRRVFEQNRVSGSTKFRNSRYQSGKNVRENQSFSDKHKNARWEERKVDNKHNHPVSLQVSTSCSVSASSALELGGQDTENLEIRGKGSSETERTSDIDLDNLKEQFEDTLRVGDEVEEKTEQSNRDKEYRSDKRGQSIMGQKVRYMKKQLVCRGDIELWNIPFITIYESLIPAEEEKVKQKQLLTLLENIVSKEWAGSRLYLYGSCANSFGFSKSDLDVCLTIDDDCMSKSDILLRLADLLQSENLENVQALTRARVPIVKLMDPTTGISCDICVNNVLAVVNTKLLRDYAVIDVRLRQLAFLVKHWAKSRGVNETYQGTLSSYAYVLMCIHFLQLRRPAILPCLQEMTATYSVTVNNVDCAFFDRVETLGGYGSHNRESISRLLWEFFHYWAYCHDYINDVISIRTGQFLSKKYKDWTRRIGNDRHLICIEDPFELSHDLGRVVDKKSIKVLIEEFERAAQIMQFDPNPCVTLFEPYIPS